MEIKQRELDKIIDKDDIVDLLCDRVESLPYNDFGYLGLYDLDKIKANPLDFHVGLSNKQYLELLMLQYGFKSIEIDKEKNRVDFERESVAGDFFKSYRVEYDEENETYYMKNYIAGGRAVNEILYYASLVYEDFRK